MSVPANAATSSNSSTPSQADDTMKTPTTLESIPIELRRQIYTHLLKADHVRQLPNKFLICSYRFETAILSVNKKIHQQASDILYNENQFVTISCDWDIILTVMSNHEVAIVCGEPNLVGRFKKNIMRLHIKFPWACYKPESSGLGSKKKTGKVLESFIILADDVPSFTRMLHIMNMTNGGEMQVTKYLFRIEPTSTGPPSLNLQKNLLEPFRYLYTKEGCVKLTGVDLDYAQDLGKTMMPPVHWVRDAAWRLYHICVSIKEVGDRALRMGLYDLAFAKYEDAQKVHKTGVHNNKRIGDVEDKGFHDACDRLLTTCETNIILASLKASTDPNEDVTGPSAADFVFKHTSTHDIEDPERKNELSWLQKARLYQYRGIAYSIKENDKLAFTNFRKSFLLDPTNKDCKRDLLITKRRLTAGSIEERSTAGTVQVSLLQDEPIALEQPVFTKSEFINGERYLLRKLGYQGDMLDHIEGSKPVDMEAMAQAERMREQQEAQLKKGEKPIVWIGGGGMPERLRPHGVGLAMNHVTRQMEVVRF